MEFAESHPERPQETAEPSAAQRLEAAQFPETVEQDAGVEPQAWELIDPDAGRYMPRRIRGSFRGRALG